MDADGLWVSIAGFMPFFYLMNQRNRRSVDERLWLLDALRAFGSISIMLHHFALYPPMSNLAAPVLGTVLDWLATYARTSQVFFVVSGYVLARSMSGSVWRLPQIGRFLVQRYCRLGLPYLGMIALVLVAYAFACGYLPVEVTGHRVTLWQLATHLLFLQDILGQEQLSAGFWFVCINFQLCLMYALILGLRDCLPLRRFDVEMAAGLALSLYSLFSFNLDTAHDIWALYFFPYFFMGVVVHRARKPGGRQATYWLYQVCFAAALYAEWRWRLIIAMAVGMLLFVAGNARAQGRWPGRAFIAWFGRISYSLFLIHFPVLVVVSTAWLRLDMTSPYEATAGLITAIALSIVGAAAYHRWIEAPVGGFAKTLRPMQPQPFGVRAASRA